MLFRISLAKSGHRAEIMVALCTEMDSPESSSTQPVM